MAYFVTYVDSMVSNVLAAGPIEVTRVTEGMPGPPAVHVGITAPSDTSLLWVDTSA
jgi:hypothetical protein